MARELRSLSTKQLLQRFAELEAPALNEMDGEYAARLLVQPNRVATALGHGLLHNPLQPWLCKAFRPVDDQAGRGYNTFSLGGRVVQRYPMATRLAASRFDGRPAYQLVYRAFHSACGAIHMVDEVRRVADGVYLGMGTWGFTEAQRRVAYPFLLIGPDAAYRGDVGRARAGFVPGHRESPPFLDR